MKTSHSETVYQCDKCARRTRVPINIYGLEVVQRCIITQNCPGKLFPIKNVDEINSTPAVTEEVQGLQDWFPRKILYTHNQHVASDTWTIVHNLGSFPFIQVVVNRSNPDGSTYEVELSQSEYTIASVDLNATTITFVRDEQGVAQLIGSASTNLINPVTLPVVSDESVVLTGNGELTIATTNDSPSISVTIVYGDVAITYVGIDNTPSLSSAWSGSNLVHINGKNYAVRSFNVLTTSPGPDYFSNNLIADGAQIYFTGMGGTPNESFVLLSAAPFNSVDKITTKVLDIFSINTVNPQTYYDKGNLFVNSSTLKTIYPPVFTVA
jgi:hypothetical protein